MTDKIHLFRMVHWQNVEYILQNGLCCREHAKADPDYINIGHRQLITDRHEHSIPIEGAGTLGEYIPFYFAGHSPMLFLIMNGYQGVTKRPQEDIVYIVCKFDNLKDTEYVYTNMNAKIALASFYNEEKDFNQIKWDIVKAQYWKNDEHNLARQDYKQAEFLVKNHIPVDKILGLIVKTEERKQHFEKIINKLALPMKVAVDKPNQFFYP